MKRIKRIGWGRALASAVLWIGSVSFIYPLLYMLATSLKDKDDFYRNPISLFIENPSFQNYRAVFSRIDIPLSFTNSFILASTSIALISLLALIASYTFAKLRFRFRYPIYLGILATMFIPAQVTMIPLYVMFSKVGLTNNLLSVILVYLAGGLPGAILLFTASFHSIPNALCESAKIDGASHMRIVFMIVLPLGKAALAINAITGFIGYWNDLFTPLILLNDASVKTAMVAITGLVGKNSGLPTIKTAGMVMTILPALVIYLLFSKAIVKGLTVGSIR